MKEFKSSRHTNKLAQTRGLTGGKQKLQSLTLNYYHLLLSPAVLITLLFEPCIKTFHVRTLSCIHLLKMSAL